MPTTLYVDRTDVKEDEMRPIEKYVSWTSPYIKDPSRTVGDVVQEVIAKVGENVRVRRFARFGLGE